MAGKTDPTGKVLTRQAWEPRYSPYRSCAKLGRHSCICNSSPGETDRKIPGTHWSDSLAELVSPWSHWETWSQKKWMLFLRMITKIIPWPLEAHVCASTITSYMPVNTHTASLTAPNLTTYIHIQRFGGTCLVSNIWFITHCHKRPHWEKGTDKSQFSEHKVRMHGLETLFAFSATVLHTLVLIYALNITDQRESLIRTHSNTVSLKYNVKKVFPQILNSRRMRGRQVS